MKLVKYRDVYYNPDYITKVSELFAHDVTYVTENSPHKFYVYFRDGNQMKFSFETKSVAQAQRQKFVHAIADNVLEIPS